MKYPYIAKLLSDDSKAALFTSPNTATALTDNFSDIKIGESDSEWHEDFYTNITHDYLSNTWGVVESKEHAEFIVELARSAGIATSDTWRGTHNYFSINHNDLLFWAGKFYAESRGEKQITTPLPPKAKEWVPEVGDEVLIYNLEKDSRLIDFNNEAVSVLAITKNERGLVLTISHPLHGIGAAMFSGEHIKKPKSKQELLIEELQTKLCINGAVDNYILACDIINGEIEGLSYEV